LLGGWRPETMGCTCLARPHRSRRFRGSAAHRGPRRFQRKGQTRIVLVSVASDLARGLSGSVAVGSMELCHQMKGMSRFVLFMYSV